MDCPGLFDTGKTNDEVATRVLSALSAMTSGPDVICYVIEIGGYTAEEHGVYQRLKALLDDSVTRYVLPIFTHGDRLKGTTIQHALHSAPKCLQQILQECGQRYVVLDNTLADPSQQVASLLETVRGMKTHNGGKPFQVPAYATTSAKTNLSRDVSARLGRVEQSEVERTQFAQRLQAKLGQAERAATSQRQDLTRRTQQGEESGRQRQAALQQEVNGVSSTLSQQQQSGNSVSSQLQALRDRQVREQQQHQQQVQQLKSQHAAAVQQKNTDIAALR